MGNLVNRVAGVDISVDDQRKDDLDDAAGDGQDETDDVMELGADD